MPGKQRSNKVFKQQKSANTISRQTDFLSESLSKWIPIAILTLATILYFPALNNEFVNYDDPYYIINNPYVHVLSLNSIKEIFTSFYFGNYHPLTSLVYLFEYTGFGLNPLPYHLFSIILHLTNIWLVFKFTEKLSGKTITASVAAILFAIHPMNVESVAWASGFKDVMFCLFYLLALLYYLKYSALSCISKYYFFTLLFFLASLLSKSSAVTFPIVLIAIDIYKGKTITRKTIQEKLPFLLLSLIFGIIAILSQKSAGALSDTIFEYGIINRIFLFTFAIASYIVRLFFPIGLSPIHYFPNIHNGYLPWHYYASLPFVISIIVLAAIRSSFRKELVFGLSFFCISIFVMLQFMPVGSHLTAERYTYIPYVGLFYIAGQWLSYITTTNPKRLGFLTLSIVALIFSAITWHRVQIWQNDTTLFNDIIEKYPNEYLNYAIRGNTEKQNGNLMGAVQDYSKAIELNPEYEDAYFNRGVIYDAVGDLQSAITDFSTSIRLNPKADVYNNRGWCYSKTGNLNAALRDFDASLSLNPTYTKAFYNRASVYSTSGNFDKAIENYNQLLLLNPNDGNAYYYRGLANLNKQDTLNACKDWQKAIEMRNEQASQMLKNYCH